MCPGDGGKDRALRSHGRDDGNHAAIENLWIRTGGFEHEDVDPNLEPTCRTRVRCQVLGFVVLLSLVALLILGMRQVEAIPTPSPLDARTEITTTVTDSVPSQPGR